MSFTYKIFVINLDASKKRWKRIKKQLDFQKLNYERVSGIDISDHKQQHLWKKYNSKKNRYNYYRTLSKGELGCYFSHINCWKKILDDEIDFGVVLEDDVKLLNNLSEIISILLSKTLPIWDYIKIGETPVKRKTRVVQVLDDYTLVRYVKKPPHGTFAQIISSSGAQKLLDNSKSIFRPVDVDIQYTWENKLIIYGVKPYLVDAIKEQSDINELENRKDYRSRPHIRLLNIITEYFHLLFRS